MMCCSANCVKGKNMLDQCSADGVENIHSSLLHLARHRNADTARLGFAARDNPWRTRSRRICDLLPPGRRRLSRLDPDGWSRPNRFLQDPLLPPEVCSPHAARTRPLAFQSAKYRSCSVQPAGTSARIEALCRLAPTWSAPHIEPRERLARLVLLSLLAVCSIFSAAR
jgi:hypothetical protein